MIKEGERHYKEYLRLRDSEDKQLLHSIRSYRKNIEEHKHKISNPMKFYGDKWINMPNEHKNWVVLKWAKESKVFEEQLAIASQVATERGLTCTKI